MNLFYFALWIGLGEMEGVYDQKLKEIVYDYTRHLEMIFNKEVTFITYKTVLAVVLVFNFFIIIATMPAIIKFGNWYTKTLKELYY